ncbi:MAG: hypothetical protein P8Y07_05695 [Gemmatimonadales bacterium]
MNSSPTADVLGRLALRNPRYAEAAYLFVLEALHHRLLQLERPRHLTGAELAESVRDLEDFEDLFSFEEAFETSYPWGG